MNKKEKVEERGIDPLTSRMLSERSTIWATPPFCLYSESSPYKTKDLKERKTNTKRQKMRIAFLHPDLGIGGAERLVVDAAVALQQQGHDVTV